MTFSTLAATSLNHAFWDSSKAIMLPVRKDSMLRVRTWSWLLLLAYCFAFSRCVQILDSSSAWSPLTRKMPLAISWGLVESSASEEAYSRW